MPLKLDKSLLPESKKLMRFDRSLFEDAVEVLKAAGHSYTRKYKGKTGKWVYEYAGGSGNRHAKGATVSKVKDHHIHEGSEFSLGSGKGHAVVEKIENGQVTFKESHGKGDVETKTMSKEKFVEMVHNAHGEGSAVDEPAATSSSGSSGKGKQEKKQSNGSSSRSSESSGGMSDAEFNRVLSDAKTIAAKMEETAEKALSNRSSSPEKGAVATSTSIAQMPQVNPVGGMDWQEVEKAILSDGAEYATLSIKSMYAFCGAEEAESFIRKRHGEEYLLKVQEEMGIEPSSVVQKAYKLDGRCVLDGLKVSIENDTGSTRKGTDPDGKEWSTTMKSPYGYIRGTKGVDGDHLDVFLGPEAQKVRKGEEGDLSTVYIVHANDVETGKYDEDKCMLGYTSKGGAVEDFKRHYDNPERFLGPVSEMTWEEFKSKIADTRENPRRLAKGEMFDSKEVAKACGYDVETEKAEGEAPEVPEVDVPEDQEEGTEEVKKAMMSEIDGLAEDVEKALSDCYGSVEKAIPAKYGHIDFTPPQSVQDEAERGLELRSEATPSNRGGLTPSEAGKQGIGSGVSRASQLKRGSKVSPEVIRKMVRFFIRHAAYKHKHKSDPGGKAQQSWKLWGGNAGRSWVNKIKRQMDAADKKAKKANGGE